MRSLMQVFCSGFVRIVILKVWTYRAGINAGDAAKLTPADPLALKPVASGDHR